MLLHNRRHATSSEAIYNLRRDCARMSETEKLVNNLNHYSARVQPKADIQQRNIYGGSRE